MPRRYRRQSDAITVPLPVPVHWARLLQTLDPDTPLDEIILGLLYHVQTGIALPGTWQRVWVVEACGEDFTAHLHADITKPLVMRAKPRLKIYPGPDTTTNSQWHPCPRPNQRKTDQ